MRTRRYLKAALGTVIGGATAGFWLIVDLLTPEPIGDYLLFGLMAVANAAIGWQVGRLMEKAKKAKTQTAVEGDEKAFKFES
ncbi:hypothetical protein ACFO4N_12450 [Camelliibacillus cellulosilyticus]|uniref:Uncharacterized protein n=1 Tax=Camelliibacillus cellulosilyticus TaxID=2174486 RepID=A0ABV9GMU1_9BACL